MNPIERLSKVRNDEQMFRYIESGQMEKDMAVKRRLEHQSKELGFKINDYCWAAFIVALILFVYFIV